MSNDKKATETRQRVRAEYKESALRIQQEYDGALRAARKKYVDELNLARTRRNDTLLAVERQEAGDRMRRSWEKGAADR